MDYLEMVNHPLFRKSSYAIHQAEKDLQEMGMTLEKAREWIQAWASGAGDGSE